MSVKQWQCPCRIDRAVVHSDNWTVHFTFPIPSGVCQWSVERIWSQWIKTGQFTNCPTKKITPCPFQPPTILSRTTNNAMHISCTNESPKSNNCDHLKNRFRCLQESGYTCKLLVWRAKKHQTVINMLKFSQLFYFYSQIYHIKEKLV